MVGVELGELNIAADAIGLVHLMNRLHQREVLVGFRRVAGQSVEVAESDENIVLGSDGGGLQIVRDGVA